MSSESIYNLFEECGKVSTDTRSISEGSLFFALKGDNFDGNKYALEALAKGAKYAVVDTHEVVGEGVVVVDDVLSALQQLACEHRRRLGIEILAITGSNGKTTTKELLTSVLSRKYRVAATKGNLNNHIGVPLTLLSFTSDIELGVVEMGASSCGEIALLCSIAQPNYGVITNIGNAHLEGFGGIEGVRRGKGELIDYLESSGGKLFVANENSEVVSLSSGRNNLKTSSYSYKLADGIESHLEGDYNRFNIATAVAVGEYMGVERSSIESAIAQYEPTNNRSQRIDTKRNSLIVDCYNANPSSMEAALRNFATYRDSPRTVIMGDMYELGEWSAEEHRRILASAQQIGAERVITVGAEFAKVIQTDNYPTAEALIEELRSNPIANQLILIKGSRSVGLERVIKYL